VRREQLQHQSAESQGRRLNDATLMYFLNRGSIHRALAVVYKPGSFWRSATLSVAMDGIRDGIHHRTRYLPSDDETRGECGMTRLLCVGNTARAGGKPPLLLRTFVRRPSLDPALVSMVAQYELWKGTLNLLCRNRRLRTHEVDAIMAAENIYGKLTLHSAVA